MADREKLEDTSDAEVKEARDEYQYAVDEKAHVREEGDIDMRHIAGDPWDPDERSAREDLNRPVITTDELTQYVNQVINDIRANKRSIKVAPAGAGATNKTAEVQQGLTRQIEYRSNAALDAYPTLFENALQRSYGYLRIKPDWVNHRSMDQELRILAIQNPNMVVEDPQGLSPTGSDWKFLYFSELWRKADFKRKYGTKAKLDSFDPAMVRQAPTWLRGDSVLVAERWRIVPKVRKLLLVQPPAPPADPLAMRQQQAPQPYTVFEDELELGKLPEGAHIIRTRNVDYPTVRQQILNGIEILDETTFPATMIPFVSCYGKILYLDDGSGPKKHLLSLIRLARSPFMLYCYYRTQQAEIASMIPKVPVAGYKGQFAGREMEWQKAPHEPMAYLEFEFTAEGWNPAWGPMPRPVRIDNSAGEHLQSLELCAEGARRAIQAAIGASPLPTQAQRHNEKSGVALRQIEDTAQRGSFHFVDHFDFALQRTGEILGDWIPGYYDAARDVTVRKPDDQPIQVRINDPDHPESVSATDGIHDVTISVGPRQVSEREAASEFADSLLNSPLMKLLSPPEAKQLASLAIRLKDVGPMGDEMADLLSPKPGEDGKPSPEQVAQLQQQLQSCQQQLGQAMQMLQSKAIDQKAKVEAESIKAKADLLVARMNNAAKIEIARISSKSQTVDLHAELLEERLSTGLQIEHEAAQAELDRQHEAAMAVMNAQHAADASERGHEQGLEAGAQGHQQALEQGQAASDAVLTQQANAAALEPAEPAGDES